MEKKLQRLCDYVMMAIVDFLHQRGKLGQKKNLLLSQAGYEENANLPSDKELAAMQLCPGRNSIRFETIRRGKHLIAEARIFLWKQNDGIVICDIDGTVTRTDIRGFVDSVVNETPTNAHAGVCDFLDQVASRAHVLYLTSRPLVLADATRFFLDNLKQSALSAGRGIGARAARMPQGPLIMARSNLTSALYSELVLKNPHEFKTWALHDILAAFVPTTKDEDQLVMPMPFKAGFGNKHTDCRAYQTAGIPNHAIFLIGTDSVLRLPYLHLHDTGGLRNTLSAHNFDQFNHDEQISSLDSNNSPVFEGYTDPHLRHRVFQILGAPPIPRPLLRPPSIRSTSV
uniref:LNS2/PITP domain-containing protein n=1 Tax=Aureoumbra lagunensis TaxID=44058 RepID=A0A7S3NRI9_9STRA|mmetsp:Transcript_11859/g.17756  ORF Transcript_11859/g.17756 Transcript_11859/m.17756 type:complete len:342 (+) Transcript_11859:543-1568(+)